LNSREREAQMLALGVNAPNYQRKKAELHDVLSGEIGNEEVSILYRGEQPE
jgi:hypothetical protein